MSFRWQRRSNKGGNEGLFTQRHIFFETAHFRNHTRIQKIPIYASTMETTENSVVPNPARCGAASVLPDGRKKKNHVRLTGSQPANQTLPPNTHTHTKKIKIVAKFIFKWSTWRVEMHPSVLVTLPLCVCVRVCCHFH